MGCCIELNAGPGASWQDARDDSWQNVDDAEDGAFDNPLEVKHCGDSPQHGILLGPAYTPGGNLFGPQSGEQTRIQSSGAFMPNVCLGLIQLSHSLCEHSCALAPNSAVQTPHLNKAAARTCGTESIVVQSNYEKNVLNSTDTGRVSV